MLTSSLSGTLTRTPKTSTPTKNYGGVPMIAKEELEKERSRWQFKIDELEAQLRKSESVNAEFLLSKAELNKKIVEMDRNQRPLMENNKKLLERNKTQQQEMRKAEEKLRHTQDDYLTLRDMHEKLLLENNKLKEKRPSPEKLDELDRFRQQNLEYSKCITALRQSAMERERRIDLLAQKVRRLRRSRVTSDGAEDDGRSAVGSGSDSISSVSLDTITEDLEDLSRRGGVESELRLLSREHADLQRAYATLQASAVELERQSRAAAQQRAAAPTDAAVVARQREQMEALRNELADARDHGDLLEFRVLELENTRGELRPIDEAAWRCGRPSSCDRSVSTSDDEAFYSTEHSDVGDDEQELGQDELKMRLTLLQHRRDIRYNDKAVVKQARTYIEQLLDEVRKQQSTINQAQMTTAQLNFEVLSLRDALNSETKKSTAEKETSIANEHKTDTVEQELRNELASAKSETVAVSGKLKASEESQRQTTDALTALKLKLAEVEESRKAEIELMEQGAIKTAAKYALLAEALEKASTRNAQLEEEKGQLQTLAVTASDEAMTALGRKYGEAKQRLLDAQRVIREYERVNEKGRDKLQQLESERGALRSELSHVKRMSLAAPPTDALLQSDGLREQLLKTQAYNRQLEAQFQLQMQIVHALKSQLTDAHTLRDAVGDCLRAVVGGTDADRPLRTVESLGGAQTDSKQPSLHACIRIELKGGLSRCSSSVPSSSSDSAQFSPRHSEPTHSSGADDEGSDSLTADPLVRPAHRSRKPRTPAPPTDSRLRARPGPKRCPSPPDDAADDGGAQTIRHTWIDAAYLRIEWTPSRAPPPNLTGYRVSIAGAPYKWIARPSCTSCVVERSSLPTNPAEIAVASTLADGSELLVATAIVSLC